MSRLADGDFGSLQEGLVAKPVHDLVDVEVDVGTVLGLRVAALLED
jgi:hypothetical protein